MFTVKKNQGTLVSLSSQLSCNNGDNGGKENITQSVCPAPGVCSVIFKERNTNIIYFMQEAIQDLLIKFQTSTIIDNTNATSITSTAYGCSKQCIAGTIASLNLTISVKCCSSDNCNTGTAEWASAVDSIRPTNLSMAMFIVVSFSANFYTF